MIFCRDDFELVVCLVDFLDTTVARVSVDHVFGIFIMSSAYSGILFNIFLRQKFT